MEAGAVRLHDILGVRLAYLAELDGTRSLIVWIRTKLIATTTAMAAA
jgi:hypothetical protein